MKQKFFEACEAAKCAAAIASLWADESGKQYGAQDVLGYMTVADESDPLDPDETDTYYFVTDKGDIGFTPDDGESTIWVFRSI